MASRDELQTLKRGLQALAILNTEGPANVACIARRLDVPRANAHRIVNTLAAEGYCRKIPNSHLYIADLQSKDILTNPCLTGLITSLSIDVIEDLGRLVKWPVALATPQGSCTVVRLATHLSTPLALAKIAPGASAPLFEASTGVTYLAFSSEGKRQQALAEVAQNHPALFAQWEPHLPRVFREVRDEGYFIMRRTGSEASLGVPIMLDGEPVAGIAMRYIKSATSRQTVVEVYLPRLQDAAREIETALMTARHPRRAQEPERHRASEPVLTWTRSAAQA
jgi:IclR family transcriptional regulator, mhp operon transcriptional activator